MGLSQRLTPVLESVRSTAREVDASATFPEATVTALRKFGLLGLTLPTDIGTLGQPSRQRLLTPGRPTIG